jgi:hypothetical protein
MLFLFAVSHCFSLLSPLFLAVIFFGLRPETRGFPRRRPTLPAVFSWNNSENSGACGEQGRRSSQAEFKRRSPRVASPVAVFMSGDGYNQKANLLLIRCR